MSLSLSLSYIKVGLQQLIGCQPTMPTNTQFGVALTSWTTATMISIALRTDHTELTMTSDMYEMCCFQQPRAAVDGRHGGGGQYEVGARWLPGARLGHRLHSSDQRNIITWQGITTVTPPSTSVLLLPVKGPFVNVESFSRAGCVFHGTLPIRSAKHSVGERCDVGG